jgi:SpoVK/Ycf46/Vps4 family AAA+-type ATPase
VLLLSTNLAPAALADEALLRRIPYKVYIPPPSPGQFKEILREQCQQRGVEASEQALDDTAASIFAMPDLHPSGSLARDVASIIVDNSDHDGCAPVLTNEALTLALQQFTARQWAEALGTGVHSSRQD